MSNAIELYNRLNENHPAVLLVDDDVNILETAKDAGLLAGASGRIAGRIRKQLVNVAKARSGIRSDTELLEYALVRVALEDDFGQKLIARQGRVPQDIDLEF